MCYATQWVYGSALLRNAVHVISVMQEWWGGGVSTLQQKSIVCMERAASMTDLDLWQ